MLIGTGCAGMGSREGKALLERFVHWFCRSRGMLSRAGGNINVQVCKLLLLVFLLDISSNHPVGSLEANLAMVPSNRSTLTLSSPIKRHLRLGVTTIHVDL